MNKLYNKILNEVYLVQDFNSWDNSEDTFKNSIKKELKISPAEIIKYFDKNWEAQINTDGGNILGLSWICFQGRAVLRWVKNEYTEYAINGFREKFPWALDEWEENINIRVLDIVKYIIGKTLYKHKHRMHIENLQIIAEKILMDLFDSGILDNYKWEWLSVSDQQDKDHSNYILYRNDSLHCNLIIYHK